MVMCSCSNVTLIPVDENPGSTLPVPDMSKVTFTQSAALTTSVFIYGADDTVIRPDQTTTGVVEVEASVPARGVSQTVNATATGSFSVQLDGVTSAEMTADVVKITARSGMEFSDTSGLSLEVVGEAPPAPQNIILEPGELDTVVVNGFFALNYAIVVRVIHSRGEDVLQVVERETIPADGDTPKSNFEALVPETAAGDMLKIYGFDPEQPDAPGPFVVEIIPTF